MTRLYVAGPMKSSIPNFLHRPSARSRACQTGLPDFNYPAFFKAEEQLLAAGYEVENPARNKPEGTASWLAYMRLSLVQISRVDGLALLPGWGDSKGARLEVQIAEGLGLHVRYLDDWLGTRLPLGHEFDGASKFPSPGGDYRCGVQLARYPCGMDKASHAPRGRPLTEADLTEDAS